MAYRQPDKNPAADTAALLQKIADQEEELQVLRLHRVMFDALLGSIPDNVYFKDINSRFLLVSEAMKSWFGAHNISDVIGKTDFDMFAYEHAKKAYDDEQKIIASGEAIVGVDEKEVWDDGKITWVSTTKIPFRDEAGNIVGTIGISRDVTQRKEAEESLNTASRAIRDEHKLLRTVIDLIPDAVYVKDENHKFVLSNKAHYANFGFSSRDEVVGKSDRDLFAEEFASTFEAGEKDVIHNKVEIRNREEEGINPLTGKKVWVLASKVPIDHYDFKGLVGVARDVTDVREYMDKLKAAKQEAEKANFEKTGFLAKMSHEIRTPLYGIIGLTELVLDSMRGQQDTDKLVLIKESADLLLSIINDLLDYSKLESGKLELENIDFNLPVVIKDIIDIVFLRKKNPGLDVTINIKSDVPVNLMGDPGRLRQILVNLLGNAKKFTAEGKVAVCVELIESAAGHVKLQFVVEDTGIGIDQDKLSVIFDSFSQADSSITRKFGGTGLGLAICKEIVKAMNGEIWVESPSTQTNVGSAFYFTAEFSLPENAKNLNYKNFARDRLALSEIKKKINGERILLVEDNPVNQQITRALLEKAGFHVDVVENGKIAIDATVKGDYALILMDVQMPEMDGPTASREIRKNHHYDHIPIIAQTAQAMDGDREKCIQAGMNDYISKPINPDLLYEKLQKWMFQN